jgi:hypothetical protein
MLRASVQHTGQPADLRSIADVTRDPLLPAGRELRDLTDAAVLRDPYERDVALPALVAAAGEPAAVRSAAVAGNFEMMNRLLDGIGVGPGGMVSIAPELGVTYPPD